MKLATTFSGTKGKEPGYAGIRAELYFDASKANGELQAIDGAAYPRLSNGQVVALVQAWRRAAARSKNPRWPLGLDLLRAGLGWRKQGDRFVMTAKHAATAAPSELVQLFWLSTAELAEQLDVAGTKRAPLIVDYSMAAYGAAAREAWREMQAELKVPGKPGQPWIEVPEEVPIKPVIPRGGGGGLLLLVVLLIVAVGTRRK